jgi:murein DD-endopeptidase MepM/ murein hydrolase activator NlpD
VLSVGLLLAACTSPSGSSADREPPDASVERTATTPSSPRARDTITTDAAVTETTVPDATATTSTIAQPTYVFPLRPSDTADYGATHHDYPATDIFTPIGTEFVAVTAGRVDFVSATDEWDPAVDDPESRGGLSVAIVGDDGIRYYGSHLSRVTDGLTEGQRVEAGQVLGLTGRSGNAAGTDPHLHFGISHPTYPEDWQVRRGELSPYPFLNAWRQGQQLRPEL